MLFKQFKTLSARGLSLLVFCSFTVQVAAAELTLQHLKSLPDLTPESFLKLFKDFKFKLGEVIQSADLFLASKEGDCDDFAFLASQVLREKGYSTRVIAVFMDKEVHVVCYVAEAKAFLDYNYRKRPSPLEPSDGTLTDIAGKVAKQFKTHWWSVSEVEYRDQAPYFVDITFR